MQEVLQIQSSYAWALKWIATWRSGLMTQLKFTFQDLPIEQPDWLVPGVKVCVLYAYPKKGGWYTRIQRRTVEAVEWPWVVYLAEQPAGGVHPSRIKGFCR